ncbi:WPP domain-interacting tail-anchored protein [Trema orientale]|uniref:WPP domain-interacting tail-anchored protein n=1 Tax=Trema orientale TaxID=63057 RepID=A0A2P5DU00_TREOI|nr:WPP domain-interacting tail-anchored protein [Trema orientale]
MEDYATGNINIGCSDSSKETDVLELENCLEVLTKVDLDLAYSSEKLVNLHGLLMYLLAQENELETIAVGNNYVSAEFMEKALVFNLLSGVLDSEVRELDSFMVSLQGEIVDAHKIKSSCRHLAEPFTMMEEKLIDSEESLKQTQHQISEVKIQSAKLQRTVLAFTHDNWKSDIAELSEHGLLSNVNAQSNMQIAGQRHILKMLEKSLARELDLEKRLTESRKTEEELKLKLHYTEQVAFHMEETAELVWGRFLEADNSVVVLKGISNELLGRLQLVHFNLNSMIQRESELKSKYQGCVEELKEKDAALENFSSRDAETSAIDAELSTLREKVKFLEEKLKESELQLSNAKATNNSSQAKVRELENLVDSLKESIDVADTRAESAELKVAELTGTNVELTEELNFLKESASNTEKRVGVLEKQLREAEIQLQHARASSEASQEQQNMLYSAIWDMETLIEDLKSKVTKAEHKTDSAEEHCIILSETNSDLTKELSILRDRIEYLEASLDQAKSSKVESSKDINVRTQFIMDLVTQLAKERERIEKQLNHLTKENKILAAKLGKPVKDASVGYNNEEDDDKDLASLKNNLSNASCAKSSLEAVKDSFGQSFQAEMYESIRLYGLSSKSDEPSQEASSSDNDVKNSVTVNSSDGTVSKVAASKDNHKQKSDKLMSQSWRS